MMMANSLEDELQEAIQRYADRHWNGALKMDKITMSLAEIASKYFAEVPQRDKRVRAFNVFTQLTVRKINDRIPIINAQKRATG